MRLLRIALLIPVLFLLARTGATGQNGPFLFTLTPLEEKSQPAFIHYDASYAQDAFEPFSGNGVEQNLGLRADLGEMFTVHAQLGLALGDGSSSTSQHAELLARVLKSGDLGVDLMAGAGVRHEYSGTNVLLGRFVLGRMFTSWQLYGNILLEKPLTSDRDNIDLMTIAGISYHISDVIRLGVEAVGQDLEGFWDENEAEGGALLYVGPTVGILFRGTPWNLTVGGGPILRATESDRVSGAVRDLHAGARTVSSSARS